MKLKIILLFCFIQLSVFATTLLTYNTYDRDNRVDLMLSFDTPYNGKIYLKKEGSNFIITLNGINFNKEVTKNINSPIVDLIKITPIKNGINIIFKTNKEINLIASKTTDGFGLRLRAKISSVANSYTQANKQTKQSFNSLPLDKTGYNENRYYIVIVILIILLIGLWILKKQLSNKSSKTNWLFKNEINENEVKILYRKPIDTKNSVLLLSYKDRKYLILSGSSNQLLDKFTKDDSLIEEEDKEFEKMFAKNRKKLDEFLKIENDTLSNYRDKASLDLSTRED